MVKTCVNNLKIRTKYTIFMHIKKKKEIRGEETPIHRRESKRN